MEAALTRDAIQKMVDGEVTCEKDMSPVLQVTGLKYVLNDSPKRFLAELSDEEKSLTGMIRVTLNELIEAGCIQTGSYVQLTNFSVDVVQGRRIIFVADLKLRDGITGQVDGPLSPGEATNMEVVMSSKPADSSFSPSKSCQLAKHQSVTKLNDLRETLRKVEGFIRDTRTTKDQIRATIRCLNVLIVDFNTCWRSFGSEVEELGGVVRPFSFASETSTCDELRSAARILLNFLTNKTIKAFVLKFSALITPYSDNTMEALKVMDYVLASGISLVNQVMHEGFDCCKYEDEDEDEDEDDDDDGYATCR